MKTDWDLRQRDGQRVLTRRETPMALWLLDRWFRVPDRLFDWIEWRFPMIARISRIPCVLYATWSPQLIMRQRWTAFDLDDGPQERDAAR
ncbi:MAG TPA: hypothetical protein VMH24_07045 [Candidatus Sulfotelmatobacter sp.]|nr:hypothetical protein [Candidatus Sulfotelmatobacter sp.]